VRELFFGALPGYAAGRGGACQATFEGSGQAPQGDQGSTPYWRHLQEAVDDPIQPRRRLGESAWKLASRSSVY